EDKNNEDHTLQCENCGTWQHIGCYYALTEEIVEAHECFDCSPRQSQKRISDAPNRSSNNLSFIVGVSPDELKSKRNMTRVRKKAMDFFLKNEKNKRERLIEGR